MGNQKGAEVHIGVLMLFIVIMVILSPIWYFFGNLAWELFKVLWAITGLLRI